MAAASAPIPAASGRVRTDVRILPCPLYDQNADFLVVMSCAQTNLNGKVCSVNEETNGIIFATRLTARLWSIGA